MIRQTLLKASWWADMFGSDQKVALDASPQTHVSKADAPILVVHGDKDPLVPVQQARDFHEALLKGKVDSTLVILKEWGTVYATPNLIAVSKLFCKTPTRRKRRNLWNSHSYKIMKALLYLILFTLTMSSSILAEEGKNSAESGKDQLDLPLDSVTEHSVTIEGRKIEYTATAGNLTLKKEDGTERASIFYIAYTSGRRPIILSGPLPFPLMAVLVLPLYGCTSVWLGPRRVKLDDFGRQPPPPYGLIDNEFSLLDKTDLVFIDPVSTGYSRASDESKAKEFHGIDGDVESVGDFIRLHLTRNRRWDSLNFLSAKAMEPLVPLLLRTTYSVNVGFTSTALCLSPRCFSFKHFASTTVTISPISFSFLAIPPQLGITRNSLQIFRKNRFERF